MDIRRHQRLIETIHLAEQFLLELFDVEKFVARIKGVAELMRRGATEGERAAAEMAYHRMMARAKEEMEAHSPAERDRFMARIKAAVGQGNDQTSSYRSSSQQQRREEPRKAAFTVGQWVFVTSLGKVGKIASVSPLTTGEFRYSVRFPDGGGSYVSDGLRRATQDEVDAALSRKTSGDGYKNAEAGAYDFQVTNIAHYADGTSNKVYGIANLKGRFYTFWGRYDGPYKAKEHSSMGEAGAQFQSKLRKGYRPMAPTAEWAARVRPFI